jgi:hypothetical protein
MNVMQTLVLFLLCPNSSLSQGLSFVWVEKELSFGVLGYLLVVFAFFVADTALVVHLKLVQM